MRDEHQVKLGAQIASLREQQGWSQRALAKWVGIDQSAVSRIEAGHRRVSADELQRIADALHVSADVLLKGAFSPLAGRAPSPAFRARAADPDFAPLRITDGPHQSAAMPAEHVMKSERFSDQDDLLAEALGAETAQGMYERRSRLDSALSRPAHGPSPDALLAAGSASPARFLESLPAGSPERGLAAVPGLPPEVTAVVLDWFRLRELAEASEAAQRWSRGHSAEGKPERVARTNPVHPQATPGGVLFDRVARFWRGELHVDADDGPLPDLVPLLEDGYGAQIIVARIAGPAPAGPPGAPDAPDADGTSIAAGSPASEHPVAASFTIAGTPFVFVNAARPVVLQRFALAHAFAHHVLGHGDVVDRRVEWSRNVPPEAAANDFAEEFLAPVRAVQRWYDRRDVLKAVRLEDLLDLGNAFGVSAWSALYRSRAAERLQGKPFQVLRHELQLHEWEVLPQQAYLGGLRDTLAFLTPGEALRPGGYGGPAVLRVPASMRAWALAALERGRLSLEDAAATLRLDPSAFAEHLERLGLE